MWPRVLYMKISGISIGFVFLCRGRLREHDSMEFTLLALSRQMSKTAKYQIRVVRDDWNSSLLRLFPLSPTS